MRLGIPSAVTRCCGRGRFLASAALLQCSLFAQLTTGLVHGSLQDMSGRPVADIPILVTGAAGFRSVIHSNSDGKFALFLPYGQYRFSKDGAAVSGATSFVAALQTTNLVLVMDASGGIHAAQSTNSTAGAWTDTTAGRHYPEAFSLPGLLLSREAASVTEPLDFTGLSDNRLAIASQRGFSWTDVQYKVMGMDANDSYQPGRAVVFPDIEAMDEVEVRSAFAQTTSSSDGSEVGIFLSGPRGLAGPRELTSWHGGLSTANTGAALASANLPPAVSRGMVQQVDRFVWFTRDRLEIGGPVTRWADFFASGSGQWASQTEPLDAPGTNQQSRLLFGNARGQVRAGARDRFDALYSGSRIDLSDGGVPAGLQALTGNRMAASYILPGGFAGEAEVDHLDFLQAGWTHLMPKLGALEVRYGYSTAHLDTKATATGPSSTELLGGQITGAPPLANLAVRTRQEIQGVWQSELQGVLGTRHQLVAGGGWKTSRPRNRFTTPSGPETITVNGVPAMTMELNTPLDSPEQIRSGTTFVVDHVSFASSLSVDLGLMADFSRGSVPAQSSPAGAFTPERNFAAQPDLVVWNSLSPQAGLAWQVPHSRGLILRGTYFRLYAPLAGRMLDFGNPNSLGGSLYQASNPGLLLLRFGGPYSSISPSLHRPYSDEFDLGAEFPFAPRSFASVHLFRRDDKDRIAAIDTGVPPQAFTPVSILDPGPDGIAGNLDDQMLTVYAQSPATMGQDRYLLTNPAGLRMLNTGVLAEAGTEWRGLALHASFVAEKAYGPTNPGDAVDQNDPGVIGALFMDPNTLIHAAGRSFVDRAYVGKMQAAYRLPRSLGGVEVASVAGYMDGLPFARQLVVMGLPQGPFLVATTPRGNVQGGNRAQYVVNWNLRVSRRFELPFGRLTITGDVLNVTNAGQRLQEEDLSGPSFNLRLPVAIEPARFVRLGFHYDF